MKKINLILILLITSFIFSCNDDDIRNLDPDDTLVTEYYENEGQFKQALLGMYMTFFNSGYYSGDATARDIVIVGDLLSDNLILNPGGRQTNSIGHTWQYDSNAPSGNLYPTSYLMISRANAMLAKVDNIDDFLEITDPNLKQHMRGHALAMRGLAHFEVARHYVKIPTQSGDANSFVGIPYVDTYDPYQQPARLGTVAEVYTRIVEDLTQALQDIPENNVGTSANVANGLSIYTDSELPVGYERALLTKNAVRGLLSRVYLYMGDYAKVIEYATPVVNSVAPAASADLQGLWRSQNSNGVLFERVVVNVDDPAVGTNYSQGVVASNIVAEYVVDKAFYDTFLPTETNRRNASIQFFGGDANIYAVKKYLQSTFGAGVQHGRYLRVEEVILNLAEAQYLSGDQGGALATLNKLRDVRYTSYAGGEFGDDLFNAIISERRKELCFETGDRWFTLKRLQGVPGIPSIHTQGIIRSGNGQFADGTGTVPTAQTLPPSSNKWQFPISQDQRNRNPNLTQTPGY